ncbi:hypothetical protein GGF42_007585 [Coemansia sp. RSA 2424]|nr:hypothetical protein GGF42_007585 [Coemansia sp. RSA 2424]
MPGKENTTVDNTEYTAYVHNDVDDRIDSYVFKKDATVSALKELLRKRDECASMGQELKLTYMNVDDYQEYSVRDEDLIQDHSKVIYLAKYV